MSSYLSPLYSQRNRAPEKAQQQAPKAFSLKSCIPESCRLASHCCTGCAVARAPVWGAGWEGGSAVVDEHRWYFSALHVPCHTFLLLQTFTTLLALMNAPHCPNMKFLFVFREFAAPSSLAALQQQNTAKNPRLYKLFLHLAGITCPPDSPQVFGQ